MAPDPRSPVNNDLDMEDDVDEEEASSLDGAPEPTPQAPTRKPPATKRPPKRRPAAQAPAEAPPSTEPKADADEEDEIQSMVEIDSVRPSLPKAVRGRLKVKREKVHFPLCEDGATPALPGYAGEVADGPGYERAIIDEWGGGIYTVTGIDKHGKPKAITVEVSGYSKPIPNTPEPMGPGMGPPMMGPGMGPRFQGSTGLGSDDFYDDMMDEPPPIGDGRTMELPPGPPPEAENGLNGFVWSAATQTWLYFQNGRRAPIPRGMRAPPAPGSNMGGMVPGGFDRGMYDHGAEDDRIARVEKALTKLTEAPREDPSKAIAAMMAPVMTMMTALMTAQQGNAQASAGIQAEAMKAQAHAQTEAAKANAEATKAAASLQAEAMKANAAASVQAAKDMAAMQQAQIATITSILTNKSADSSPAAIMDMGMRMAEMVVGGRQPGENVAGQIADAVKTAAPAVAESVANMFAAAKGGSLAATSGVQVPQATGDLGEAGQVLQLVGFLVKQASAGRKANPRVLANGCDAFNLDYGKVRQMFLVATPDIVAKQVRDTVAKIPNAPPSLAQLPSYVEGVALSQGGRAWFAELQRGLREDIQKEQATAAAIAATAPPAQIPAQAQPPAQAPNG